MEDFEEKEEGMEEDTQDVIGFDDDTDLSEGDEFPFADDSEEDDDDEKEGAPGEPPLDLDEV